MQRWGRNRDEAEAPGAAEGQNDPLKTAASAAWQPITSPVTVKEPQVNNNQTQCVNKLKITDRQRISRIQRKNIFQKFRDYFLTWL